MAVAKLLELFDGLHASGHYDGLISLGLDCLLHYQAPNAYCKCFENSAHDFDWSVSF